MTKGPLDREDDFNGGPANPFYVHPDRIAEIRADECNRIVKIIELFFQGSLHAPAGRDLISQIREQRN